MRKVRIFLYLTLILAALLSCRVVVPTRVPYATPVESTSLIGSPQAPTITPLAVTPTLVPSFTPEAATPSPSLTATPVSSGSPSYQMRYHPDGLLYVGDQVSIEVIAPRGENVSGKQVQVALPTAQGLVVLDAAGFALYGLGGRTQATFPWSWDTTGLSPGGHEITFSILPEGPIWRETVILLPAEALLPPESGAQWAMAESDCCQVYYLMSVDMDYPTAAQRDLDQLLTMVDEQAQDVSQKLGVNVEQKMPLVFMPRVIGHGGFTASEIMVSYLDRNYAGSNTALVVHHEIVHLVDGLLGGELKPSLLVEGLAVYLTGGHFKPEPLMGRAAALLPAQEGCVQPPLVLETPPLEQETTVKPGCGLDRYIPLSQLADNFYPSQHEIGYLEAGALIEYLVQVYGWPAFSNFYRDIHPVSRVEGDGMVTDPSQAKAIEAALQEHFNLSLDALDANFRQALEQLALTPQLVDDVRLSVAYYDTLRRYQQLFDPSAYFLYAWLPDGREMRNRGIVADLLRRPDAPENQALENLFVTAELALQSGDYAQTEQLLSAIQAVLDAVETSK